MIFLPIFFIFHPSLFCFVSLASLVILRMCVCVVVVKFSQFSYNYKSFIMQSFYYRISWSHYNNNLLHPITKVLVSFAIIYALYHTFISVQNSREEVITATAYLDLFIRRITEPTLIKAFLRFILCEKYDEIVILESLITRINSNSKVSASL